MAVDLASAEQRIRFRLAGELSLAGTGDALCNVARRLTGDGGGELGLARRGHLELDVDAVGERPGDAAAIARNALRSAAAAPAAIAAVAAGTRIHGGDQLKARREFDLARRARDRHAAGLDRL